MLRNLLTLTLSLGLLAACGGGGGSNAGQAAGSSTTSSGQSSAAASSAASASSMAASVASSKTSSTATQSNASSSAAASSLAACSGSFMGHSKLLIGAQMEDATAAAAPFDVRYRYLAGGIRDAGSCTASCDGSCGSWWGCWQDTSKAPGQYILSHIQTTGSATWQGKARAQIPAITYYELLHGAKTSEGAAEVAAINDAAFLARYLDDWRFLLQTIGGNQALLHIEPDFWGFVRQSNASPQLVPAKVSSANPTDCGSQANTATGLAKCMIAMVRKYAPNAKVGLHASPWLSATSGDGIATGNFMVALGAGDGDFVVTDPSDRDAGYYESIGQNRWWTDTSAAAYLAWSKAVSDTVGKPSVMWQIPLGNAAQTNTTNHWKDNRVDYLFSHLTEVRNAKVVALLFGAGDSNQTTPESDGGNLISQTTSYWQAGGTPLCQ
ncbi:hypothetical protein [Uliginosibacterium sp. TH139]|uniref:hypothetical protein n=1 Tax=Uliginosibacterium sp. TH139 TaxID=2067453 RepID=UPI0020B14B96|nr:hypothetical protein [Uliginosibacterium sp. TH139]